MLARARRGPYVADILRIKNNIQPSDKLDYGY